ncbi:MAG TPA: hypothetical protein VFQ30_06845 [Ktedonobacteraceae bacterium]|nr:hypothetical protein [Ktedonobacteraceae bacterium]
MIEIEFKITSVFKEDEKGEYIFEVYDNQERRIVDLYYLIGDIYQKTYTQLYPNDKLTVTFHIERA